MTEVQKDSLAEPSESSLEDENALPCEQANQPVCEICSKTFLTSSRLDRHIKLIHECEDCHLQFKNRSRKKRHVEIVHGRKIVDTPKLKQTLDCEICSDKVQDTLGLERHLGTTHHMKLYRCKECNLNMTNRVVYMAHNLKFHPERLKTPGRAEEPELKMTFDCEICSEKFKDSLMLKIHLTTEHQKKLYRCQACNLNITNVAMMRTHNLEFHADRRKQKKNSIPTKGCEICDEKFRTVVELGRHLNVVHRNKFYSCGDCDLTLASIFLFREHMKKFHPGKIMIDPGTIMSVRRLKIPTTSSASPT